jgi:hypothetical protein
MRRTPPNRKIRRRRARAAKRPTTAEQFFAKPERFQETWTRLTAALAKMRSANASLKQASKEARISPRTVIRLGGSALKKGTNGRYFIKPSDQLLRVLKVPTPDGSREIGVRGSRQASVLGEYWAAVHKYLATGDASSVEKFRGKQIKDSAGIIVPLLTDLKELNRLGSAGVLSFESLYARSA